MGIFSCLFKQKGKTPEPEVHVTGDIRFKLYVYDGRPLESIPDGARFTAEVVSKPVVLESTLTSNVWDSSDGGICFAFDGVPFGVSFNDRLAAYLRSVGATHIDMERDGWYDRRGRIPEVTLFAPSLRPARSNISNVG